MSLSQDEINALLKDDTNDDAGIGSDDIMSPEAIAAMLDASVGEQDMSAESDSDGIMSPEDIAAMLDGAVETSDMSAESDTDDIMLPDDITAMLDEAAGDSGTSVGTDSTDILSPEDIAAMLDNASGEQSADAVASAAVVGMDGMLTHDEVDILGEIGNISMGAVATTMYSILDKRVSITTPRVKVFEAKEVLTVYQIPFVVATIEYVEGIEGNNLLVLKVEDAAMITDLLMGGDGVVEQPIELNEMHLSAMSEIMNQMMGASSTALSKLLHTTVNISPPSSTTVDAGFDVSSLLGDIDLVTKISFDMEIEGLLKSELIQLMPYDVSRGFATRFMEVGMGVPATGAEAAAPPTPEPPAPPPQPKPAPPPSEPPQSAPHPPAAQETYPVLPPVHEAAPDPPPVQPPYQQPYTEQFPPQMPYQQPAPQMPYPQAPYPPYPPYPPAPYPSAPYQQESMNSGRLVDVHPMQFQSFDAPGPPGEQRGIDLVYNIPLQVTVELGKTKKEISEILEFGTGTIVVLDKMAGDPVEIVVNGKLIARGEVVVIDENYGVRITDIING